MPLRLLLAFLLLSSMSAANADGSSKLQLTAEPPLEQVRPNRDEVRLTLLSDGEETARKTVQWSLVVEIPLRGRFFSTDFPWIEGKRLLEIDFLTQGQKVEWTTVFPIRGRYELRVKSKVEGEAPGETTFSLVIREDPARQLYLALSLSSLFLLGCLIGWVTPRSGTLLILSFFFLEGVASEARLDVGPAKVGDLTRVKLTLSDPGAANVNFSIVRLEDQRRLFHIEEVTVPEGVSWGYHFFDGSPHLVTAAVRPHDSASPSLAEREVRVEALEPPRKVVFATYVFFLLPLAFGWLAGRWVKRRRGHSV
jgi:hypothetical protein